MIRALMDLVDADDPVALADSWITATNNEHGRIRFDDKDGTPKGPREMEADQVIKKQCGKCPWRVTTDPHADIPHYSEEQHRDLDVTIAAPACLKPTEGVMMVCHETSDPNQKACAGWLIQQLGPGNNIGLRLLALDGRFKNVQVEGEQHERFEDTLPE